MVGVGVMAGVAVDSGVGEAAGAMGLAVWVDSAFSSICVTGVSVRLPGVVVPHANWENAMTVKANAIGNKLRHFMVVLFYPSMTLST